mgnify:CR=1
WTSVIDLPIIPVDKFGSNKDNLDSVANIGAEE